MKLASLKSGSRDGALAVVSRDLSKCVPVPRIAHTLQHAIETWSTTAPKLKAIYHHLNDETAEHAEPFSPERAESPLPRAYQFLDGSVYLSHMQKARKARGAEMPDNFETEPLMYQAMSDGFIGPVDDMLLPTDELGVDFEAEIAVVVDDVPMGTSAVDAMGHIKLVMLLNDFTLRTLTRTELPKGFGFMQAKPTSGFSPVAVTPDELPQWDGQKLNVRLISTRQRPQVRRAACRPRHVFLLSAAHRACRPHAQARRRHHPRRRHGRQQGRKRRLILHRRNPRQRRTGERQSHNAIPEIRRPRPHRGPRRRRTDIFGAIDQRIVKG